MSEQIRLLAMGDHEFSVDVTEGPNTTTHRVTVPQELLDDLGLPTADQEDEERVVRESFDFLLEREKSTQILPEFPLEVISTYFSDYLDEMRTRLTG